MSLPKFNPRTTVLLIMIIVIGALRVIFNFSYEILPLANFSPLGAMALFGGAYFNKSWKAFAFPLLTLFISDFILHQTVFKAFGNGFFIRWMVLGLRRFCINDNCRQMDNASCCSSYFSAFCCHLCVYSLGNFRYWRVDWLKNICANNNRFYRLPCRSNTL